MFCINSYFIWLFFLYSFTFNWFSPDGLKSRLFWEINHLVSYVNSNILSEKPSLWVVRTTCGVLKLGCVASISHDPSSNPHLLLGCGHWSTRTITPSMRWQGCLARKLGHVCLQSLHFLATLIACPCAYVELICVHRLAWLILRVLYLPLPAWYSVIFRLFLFSRGDLFFRCLRNLSSLGQMLLSKEKLQQWGLHVLLCCPYTKSVGAHWPSWGWQVCAGSFFLTRCWWTEELSFKFY